ncbi:hypothetical protein DM860_018119 [Cuscuta australis]|uniref:Uncharacterized protein n=1 Tax=Cuscuta australis TaxID=267555 RepID=A0A328DV43_9ASTE|nr:hypothetical protein DM860_018119 [Cuscuta australis]
MGARHPKLGNNYRYAGFRLKLGVATDVAFQLQFPTTSNCDWKKILKRRCLGFSQSEIVCDPAFSRAESPIQTILLDFAILHPSRIGKLSAILRLVDSYESTREFDYHGPQ